MKKVLISLLCFVIPLIFIFYSIKSNFFYLIFCYLQLLLCFFSIAYLIGVKRLSKNKIIVIAHLYSLAICISGYIFDRMSYLFNHKNNIILVSKNSLSLSFFSENLIYLSVYLIFILFIFDIIYFLRRMKNN